MAWPIVAFAAEQMAPSDIKATFFNGLSFTASTPGGTKFKMTFTPDGKMTREPLAESGSKNTGTWKLNATSFCTTWQHAKPSLSLVASLSSRRARTNGQFKRLQPQLQSQWQCGPNSDLFAGIETEDDMSIERRSKL